MTYMMTKVSITKPTSVAVNGNSANNMSIKEV